MRTGLEFKTKFTFDEVRDIIEKRPLIKAIRGGESYYMGVHVNVDFENGVKVVIYDTASADALAANPKWDAMSYAEKRKRFGYDMDISMPDNVDGDLTIDTLLKAIEAYDIKRDKLK